MKMGQGAEEDLQHSPVCTQPGNRCHYCPPQYRFFLMVIPVIRSRKHCFLFTMQILKTWSFPQTQHNYSTTFLFTHFFFFPCVLCRVFVERLLSVWGDKGFLSHCYKPTINLHSCVSCHVALFTRAAGRDIRVLCGVLVCVCGLEGGKTPTGKLVLPIEFEKSQM